jgi:hypothetical protein
MMEENCPVVEINANPKGFTFEPGIGWVYTITDPDMTEPVKETVRLAMIAGTGLKVRLNASRTPVPPGQSVAIRAPNGVMFNIGAAIEPSLAQAAMQSAKPEDRPETAAILSHRRGVDVHARTLRRKGAVSNAVGDRPLIDELNAASNAFIPATPGPVQTTIMNSARVARGFVLDKAASFRIGELCITAADIIADSQEFARLPYPVMWVELDQSSVLAGMKSKGGAVLDESIYMPDERLGFLYTGHGVYSGARTVGHDDEKGVGWSPFAFRMGRPMSDHQRDRWRTFIGGDDDIIDQFLWGNAYPELDRTRRKALRHYSGIDILLPDSIVKSDTPTPLAALLQGGGAGDWKLALATLLVLIRPGNVEYGQTRKPQRRLTGKGTRKMIGLTTVTINISARKVKANIKTAVEEHRRGSTRWHEVRGHYVHNRKARTSDCIHDWSEAEPDRWICQHCGGKRSWRTYPNGKGSIEAGVVAKHYRVTTKGQ